MKANLAVTFFLLFPLVNFAQYDFRPVLDSSALCSRNLIHWQTIPNPLHEYRAELHIYYTVTDMPEPKKSIDEFEEFLNQKVRLNEQEIKNNAVLYFQCVVNCRGEAADYQVIHCPPDLVNVGCQVLTLFRENLKQWDTPMQRDKEVDLLARIKVDITEGRFNIIAPVY